MVLEKVAKHFAFLCCGGKMKEEIVIYDQGRINEITDFIHDCWFDIDKIVFEQESRTLKIFFVKDEDTSKKVFSEYCLNFFSVVSYKIVDSEKIGLYDFNKLIYNPMLHEIAILTGVPIDIRIKIEEFKISLTRLKCPSQ